MNSIQQEANSKSEPQYTMSLRDMINKVETEPVSRFIYSGIKEGGIGLVFGPSKSGKTIFCENLAMAIAAGRNEYMGCPIDTDNRKVLVISLEEHYKGRTERNMKQITKFDEAELELLLDNYKVVTEDMPMYISTQEHWKLLKSIINEHDPGVVFVDSVTRMCTGIEESAVAQVFTRNLRKLAEETGTTIVPVHHTHKMYGQPITIDTIAGSRVLAQEMDFMIGINKTLEGKRYIKDVAFRYIQEDSEHVKCFSIDENCWLTNVTLVGESKLLAGPDGRTSEINTDKLLAYITDAIDDTKGIITTDELIGALVETKVMARPTLFSQLTKLTNDGKIVRSQKGEYKLAA